MEAFGKLSGGFTVCSKTMAFVPFGTIPTVTTKDSLHTELYKGGGEVAGGRGGRHLWDCGKRCAHALTREMHSVVPEVIFIHFARHLWVERS